LGQAGCGGLPQHVKWLRAGGLLVNPAPAAPLSGTTQSQKEETSMADQAIYVVTHVDIMNKVIEEAEAALKKYGADAKKEPGAVRIEVTQETARRNHFTILEVWASMKQFEEHEAAAQTRKFREVIQPMLGGPLDSRLHYIFQ
jgi:quinol monooxygenase YgiN